MFFIVGVTNGEKRLDFSQLAICKACGRYGKYEVFMTYTAFTLFFIPLIKWNKRYFVRETICGARCEINAKLGGRIESGEKVSLSDGDLKFRSRSGGVCRVCPNCGFETREPFKYCPMCGKPII